MTDAEFEACKQRVTALLEKWTKVIGLGWWRISHDFHREEDTEHEGAGSVGARCAVYWQYLEAHIDWFCPTLVDLKDDALENCVVHELMHIFVREMREDAESEGVDHEERVCTTLANGFIWLREHMEEQANQTASSQVAEGATVGIGD